MSDQNKTAEALHAVTASPLSVDKPSADKRETNKRSQRHGKSLSSYLLKNFYKLLDGLQQGRLDIVWPDNRCTSHGSSGELVTLTLRNYDPVRRLLFHGSNGFAESYIEGHWDVDDLDAFFMLIMHNEARIADQLIGGWLARVQNVLSHALRRNSRAGSKKNITFHYDLGNAFYNLWLDKSMMYSSALFASPDQSLEQAQQNKTEHILDLLDVDSMHKVLEIGCGWGALSHAIAEQGDCSVDALSLSNEQLEYARQNNTASDRVNYQYCDYRDAEGRYDRIVSIEMFEAVGLAYWDRYFSTLNQLLAKDGTVVLQVITIEQDRFDEYARNPDFIQRYIFPGGMLPTREKLDELIQRWGFKIDDQTWFGQDYALTLQMWRQAFENKLNDVRSLGYDEKFIRMWRYYLSYCETGFLFGSTDVGIVKLSKN